MDVGHIARSLPPRRERRLRLDRGELAALGVEVESGHRGIQLVRHEEQRQARMKGKVTRARARTEGHIAAVYMLYGSRIRAEAVDKHAIDPEVRCNCEAVRG